MSELKNILEQVKKTIPINKLEKLQKDIMIGKTDLNDVVKRIWEIKTEFSMSEVPYKHVLIYEKTHGLDHVLYNLLLRKISTSKEQAKINQQKKYLMMIYDIKDFELIRFRYDHTDVYHQEDYFEITPK